VCWTDRVEVAASKAELRTPCTLQYPSAPFVCGGRIGGCAGAVFGEPHPRLGAGHCEIPTVSGGYWVHRDGPPTMHWSTARSLPVDWVMLGWVVRQLIGELRCNLIAFRPPPLRHACGCRYLDGVQYPLQPCRFSQTEGRDRVRTRHGRPRGRHGRSTQVWLPHHTPVQRSAPRSVCRSQRGRCRLGLPRVCLRSPILVRAALVKSDVAVHAVECHNSRPRRARHRTPPDHLRLEFGHRHPRLR
jgi:hypothetical protein